MEYTQNHWNCSFNGEGYKYSVTINLYKQLTSYFGYFEYKCLEKSL
jgi:hypothetical protein